MYVVPDLKRLAEEIRPDRQTGLRGCTVPLALTIFSLIDFFGYLTRPDKDASKLNTERNFKFLLAESGFFPSDYTSNWERILKLFRHGLVHQFFPKAAAIAKAGVSGLVIRPNREKVLELNVDVLSRDTMAALAALEKAINSPGNEELVLRINERLDKLAMEDYEDLAKLSFGK